MILWYCKRQTQSGFSLSICPFLAGINTYFNILILFLYSDTEIQNFNILTLHAGSYQTHLLILHHFLYTYDFLHRQSCSPHRNSFISYYLFYTHFIFFPCPFSLGVPVQYWIRMMRANRFTFPDLREKVFNPSPFIMI